MHTKARTSDSPFRHNLGVVPLMACRNCQEGKAGRGRALNAVAPKHASRHARAQSLDSALETRANEARFRHCVSGRRDTRQGTGGRSQFGCTNTGT